ncbi:lytic cellulose monooxygenase-like isoform X2 [Oryza brachyantha]|uniref:lytic cellulose monooxygenase-like isoform X2 n=1 Tax=Oryza brachyantha TaxID=4533 RepID=UPI0007764FE1|nr:lytic cellulose monooxygenase-like isoform X2 [Oryza brachyantha]
MEDLIPGDVRLPRDGEPSGVIYEEEEEMDVDEAFDYEEGEFPCTDLLDDSGDSEDGGGNGWVAGSPAPPPTPATPPATRHARWLPLSASASTHSRHGKTT